MHRDIAPEGASLAESNAMLDKVVELAAHLQGETGKKVLWGTAQLFKHPRFAHGGATSEPYPSQVHSRSGLLIKLGEHLPGRCFPEANAFGALPDIFISRQMPRVHLTSVGQAVTAAEEAIG